MPWIADIHLALLIVGAWAAVVAAVIDHVQSGRRKKYVGDRDPRDLPY